MIEGASPHQNKHLQKIEYYLKDISQILLPVLKHNQQQFSPTFTNQQLNHLQLLPHASLFREILSICMTLQQAAYCIAKNQKEIINNVMDSVTYIEGLTKPLLAMKVSKNLQNQFTLKYEKLKKQIKSLPFCDLSFDPQINGLESVERQHYIQQICQQNSQLKTKFKDLAKKTQNLQQQLVKIHQILNKQLESSKTQNKLITRLCSQIFNSAPITNYAPDRHIQQNYIQTPTFKNYKDLSKKRQNIVQRFNKVKQSKNPTNWRVMVSDIDENVKNLKNQILQKQQKGIISTPLKWNTQKCINSHTTSTTIKNVSDFYKLNSTVTKATSFKNIELAQKKMFGHIQIDNIEQFRSTGYFKIPEDDAYSSYTAESKNKQLCGKLQTKYGEVQLL